ncbi:hypothetical protein F4777DRAFT_593821 [Nemania sp. FL0916]|nr:hypothetical protein F4777DRAFT_593821 [Nemania sp. FL0916]
MEEANTDMNGTNAANTMMGMNVTKKPQSEPIQVPVDTLKVEDRLLGEDKDFNTLECLKGRDISHESITYGFEKNGEGLPADPEIYSGFSVLDDHEVVEVTAPSDEATLYFNYAQHPWNPNGSLKLKTPQNHKPCYSPFVYQRTSLPQESLYACEKFVFTGSNDSGIGSFLRKNIFIPLDALKLRLNGTKEERRIAYTQDWLTFCNYVCNSDHTNQGFINQSAEAAGFSDEIGHRGKTYLAGFNGSHLKIRDSTGANYPNDSLRFLGLLLEPSSRDKCTNLPLFIFKRWCAVAYAASFLPKEPFSVSARFWSCPMNLSDPITFIYDKPQDMMKNIQRIINSDGGQISDFNNPTEEQLEKIWRDAIKEAHNNAKSWAIGTLTSLASEKSMGEIVTSNASNQKDGPTPEGTPKTKEFFTIWIHKNDVEKLMTKKYYTVYDSRKFPEGNPGKVRRRIDKYDQNTVTNGNVGELTVTNIKQSRIETAGNFPRCKTQAAVMGGVSATQVAERIWGKDVMARAAEWLHRSAYSYGGIGEGNTNADTSQVVENLVFGTYEANTKMIRYEEYLKRMAKRLQDWCTDAKILNKNIDDDMYTIRLETKTITGAQWVPHIDPQMFNPVMAAAAAAAASNNSELVPEEQMPDTEHEMIGAKNDNSNLMIPEKSTNAGHGKTSAVDNDPKLKSGDDVLGIEPQAVASEDEVPNWDTTNLSWMVRGLNYVWHMPILNTGIKAKMQYDFDVFSRNYPTRFETEVDEKFEKVCFKDPERRKFLFLWMMAQSEATPDALAEINPQLEVPDVEDEVCDLPKPLFADLFNPPANI